jgi:dihydroorotate dehydrogenase
LCRETPIISGGGIDSYEEVVLRKCLGAKAFSFGTLFLQKPWLPNRIIKRCQHVWKNKAEK